MTTMATTHCLLALLTLLALTFTTAVKYRHSAIVSHLRKNSDWDTIPLPDNNDSPVEVNIRLSLNNILDVDRGKKRDRSSRHTVHVLEQPGPRLGCQQGGV
ncbi:hypothetical protein BsWGS_22725 [Bradybaena similaris]